MYNAISLTNNNETKCGLQNKNYAKMSLHIRWPKRDETKCYNVISSRFVAFPVSHFRGWHQGCQVFATKPAQLLLKTSPKLAQLHFEGGFPGKVRIPGAKYHVIGVASTPRTWKTTHGNSVKVAQFCGKAKDMATLCADAGDVTSSSPTRGII